MSDCQDIIKDKYCFKPTDAGQASVTLIKYEKLQGSQKVYYFTTIDDPDTAINPDTYLGGGVISLGSCGCKEPTGLVKCYGQLGGDVFTLQKGYDDSVSAVISTDFPNTAFYSNPPVTAEDILDALFPSATKVETDEQIQYVGTLDYDWEAVFALDGTLNGAAFGGTNINYFQAEGVASVEDLTFSTGTQEALEGEAIQYAECVDGEPTNPAWLDSLTLELVDPALLEDCEESGGGGLSADFTEQICFSNGTNNFAFRGWVSQGEDGSNEYVGHIISTDGTDVTVGEFIEIPAGYYPAPCQYNITTEVPSSITRTCYLETTYDAQQEIGMLSTTTAGGHERIVRTSYYAPQFNNEGDVNGTTEGWHSEVTFDHDGVPQVDGEAPTSVVAGIVTSESSTRGGLTVWEGILHVPEYYHLGSNQGKRVTSFKLHDIYTSTTHADRDELFLSIDGTAPTLDRSNLTSVAVAQQGVNFTFPSSWGGQDVRFALAHGDKGNTSQVSIRATLTLDDGTVLVNQDIRDWLWLPDSPPASIGTIQRKVTRVVDSVAGTEVWVDENNVEIDATTLQQPLQEVGCSDLPISYEVTALAGSITIGSVSGGAGGPYEYSFDGGATWGTSDTLNLSDTSDGTEPDIMSVRPAVRDSSGVASYITSTAALIGDPEDQSGTDLRVTDTINGENNNPLAIESNDSDQPGGYIIDYGQALNVDPDMNTTTISGSGQVVVQTSNWITVNRGTPQVGGVDSSVCIPASAGTAGEDGVLRVDLQNYYYGNSGTNINIELRVVDINGVDLTTDPILIRDNDNDPLGEADVVFNENTLQNRLDNDIKFTHNGNNVCLKIIDTSTTSGVDSTGHFWRFQNLEVYEGAVVNGTQHFYRVNSYIDARGIDAPESDPATMDVALGAVDKADLIRLTGSFQRVGTWDEGQDGWRLEYQLDGGSWVTIMEQDGQWEIGGEMYTTPFKTDTIDVSGASDINARLSIWGDGNSSESMRIYRLSFEEVLP